MKYDYKYKFRRKRDKLYLFLAAVMPKRLVLWCFIMVCADKGDCPDPFYSEYYDHWTGKHNLTDM